MRPDAAALLRAYDAHLRGAADVLGATDVTRDGPLLRARFGPFGVVAYRDLAGVTDLASLVARTVAHFAAAGALSFEWKTRGHDAAPGLGEILRHHGLTPEAEETVVVGPAEVDLGNDTDPRVRVRRAGVGRELADDLARADRLHGRVFGKPLPPGTLERLGDGAGPTTLWLAEAGDDVVGAGRLELVPGTPFAGLWGGATEPGWRGRGVYRALTAARARHARALGVRYLHSDCLPASRPILESAGLTAVTTTTPFVWRR